MQSMLFGKFIKRTDLITKEKLHNDYKSYRNIISTLLEQSKQNYHDRYFKDNINNMKVNLERNKTNIFSQENDK